MRLVGQATTHAAGSGQCTQREASSIALSVSKEITKFHTLFEKGFDAYLKKEWDKALELFNDLQIKNPEDKPVRIYVQRCKALLDNPPAVTDDWDGVMSLTEK